MLGSWMGGVPCPPEVWGWWPPHTGLTLGFLKPGQRGQELSRLGLCPGGWDVLSVPGCVLGRQIRLEYPPAPGAPCEIAQRQLRPSLAGGFSVPEAQGRGKKQAS